MSLHRDGGCSVGTNSAREWRLCPRKPPFWLDEAERRLRVRLRPTAWGRSRPIAVIDRVVFQDSFESINRRSKRSKGRWPAEAIVATVESLIRLGLLGQSTEIT